MSKFKLTQSLVVVIALLGLYGCGSAQVKTDTQTPDMRQYDNVLIRDVKVYSLEEAAKDNDELQKKLQQWASFSKTELEGYARRSPYELVNSLKNVSGKTLIVDLDVNVKYGNRALRWAIGFGAGSGAVDSTLTMRDANSGKVKFHSQAHSDLSIGFAGGDMELVLQENIRELLKDYKGS